MIRVLLLVSLFCCSTVSADVIDFANPDQEYHYNLLIKELRCAVCQNQNLADSHADLAKDMRSIVLEMIEQGKTDKEIKEYMVMRYGNFVLYRPPVDRYTMFLWFAPLVLLLVAIWMIIRLIKKRQQVLPPTMVTDEEQAALAKLMAEKNEKDA